MGSKVVFVFVGEVGCCLDPTRPFIIPPPLLVGWELAAEEEVPDGLGVVLEVPPPALF